MPRIIKCDLCKKQVAATSQFTEPDGFFCVQVSCKRLKKEYVFCADHAAKLGITKEKVDDSYPTPDLMDEIVERVIEEIGDQMP